MPQEGKGELPYMPTAYRMTGEMLKSKELKVPCEPLNLKELYGARFKIELDEAAFCEPGGRKNPWYFKVLCRYGDIYPYSDLLLGFFCNAAKVRGRLHQDHPEIEVRQWSDIGEAVFLFRPDQFDLVAQYARPRKRRQISDREKKRLARIGTEALRRHKKPTIIDSTEPTDRRPRPSPGVDIPLPE